MRLQVTDDSGFLALVDPDSYSGFVAEVWDLDALRARFREQMAVHRLLIWGTGQEGSWTVRVHVGPDAPRGLREVSGSITSSRGRLLLTNYESLTMAAQFADVTLPEKHQEGLVVALKPGVYTCRVVQHALHHHGWQQDAAPEFSLVLENGAALLPAWEQVPWSNDL